MGLFKKKSKDELLQTNKNRRFNEIEKEYGDDPELARMMQVNWLCSRGRHLISEQEYGAAENDFRDALTMDKENILTIMTLSALLRETGRTEEALSIFIKPNEDKYMDDAPVVLFNYYYEWGTVFALLDRYDKALKMLEKALVIGSDKKRIDKYLDRIKEAEQAGLEFSGVGFNIEADLENLRDFIADIKVKTKKTVVQKRDREFTTTTSVATAFVSGFLDNIDGARDNLVNIIVSDNKKKLIVSPRQADSILFRAFLAYWTLPLFNLFSRDIAEDVFVRICNELGAVYEIESEKLAEGTLIMMNEYEESYVHNSKRFRGGAWVLDKLIKDNDAIVNVQFESYMLSSLILDWKGLSEDVDLVLD